MRSAAGPELGWSSVLALCLFAGMPQPPALAQASPAMQAVKPTLDVEHLLGQGRDAQAKGAPEQAVGFFQRAVLLDPKLKDAWVELGVALADLERYDEARGAFERALAGVPEDAAALNGLGYVHYRQSRVPDAIACYRRALTQRDEPQYHLNLGLAYLSEERWGQASDEFERTLAGSPADYWGLNDLGYALQRQGRLQEAAERYQAAMALEGTETTAHLNLGGLLVDAEDWETAVWAYQEALKRDDASADAHLGLALALAREGRDGESQRETRVALQLDGGRAAAHHLMADLYRRESLYDRALGECRAAIALDPAEPSFELTHGRILEAMARRPEATTAYRRFLDRAPDSREAEGVRDTLRLWGANAP